MPEERLTKNQRREQARELARKEREKAQRRERLTKILVPVIVVVALIAVAVTTTVIIVNQPKPAPIAANGPKNMISDGIVFTGQNGTIVATKTAALTKGETPTPVPTDTSAGAPIHITTYIDWACPYCKAFEQANSAYIQKLVESGAAVLQVMPVAIVDRSYQSSRYASRANNAAACVANYDPDQFLAVQQTFYNDQPAEGTSGLTNSQIATLVKNAGVNDDKVTACINGESFKNWVVSATQRALADPTIQGPQGFGTPT
ncbi:DsbA family protein, partial [Mesorhizobium japonicum]|uniref:DsbA family protein n=1 Tax=Mesorhizobium japonicum TaxID=2066070 RepID=UPI003B5A3091